MLWVQVRVGSCEERGERGEGRRERDLLREREVEGP
jgi:hypothetical protein